MALSATAIYDGRRCKIVEITESDPSGVAAELATSFTSLGMATMQGLVHPLEIIAVQTAGPDERIGIAVKQATSSGFTVRRLTATVGKDVAKWIVSFRNPRGIAG